LAAAAAVVGKGEKQERKRHGFFADDGGWGLAVVVGLAESTHSARAGRLLALAKELLGGVRACGDGTSGALFVVEFVVVGVGAEPECLDLAEAGPLGDLY
jgi:hypothetical protein